MRVAVVGTGLIGASVAPSASEEPHSLQKRMPGSFAAPQAGQGRASARPHPPQNFDSARFSVVQFGQTIKS
jgi:glycine/D-amino acid oxidase-like deaminating enzyme